MAAGEGVAFIPDAQPGFDSLAVRPEENAHVLPRALGPRSSQTSVFAASLALAGALVDPSLGLLNVTSWNEWNEDSQIEPTTLGPAPTSSPPALTQGYSFQPYGFSFLDVLKRFEDGWH